MKELIVTEISVRNNKTYGERMRRIKDIRRRYLISCESILSEHSVPRNLNRRKKK